MIESDDIKITPVYLIEIDGDQFLMTEDTLHELQAEIRKAMGV